MSGGDDRMGGRQRIIRRIGYAILSLLIAWFDAATKGYIASRFSMHDSLEVIPGLFQIVHIQNRGAAFGLGAASDSPLVPLLLNIGAIAVFVVVVIYSLREPLTSRRTQVALHLIMGGAIGNLFSRFWYGAVVDFLDFYISTGGREHHWPAFNLADVAICVGILLLLFGELLFPGRKAAP